MGETQSVRYVAVVAVRPQSKSDPIQVFETRILIENGSKLSPTVVEKSLRASEGAGRLDPAVAHLSHR